MKKQGLLRGGQPVDQFLDLIRSTGLETLAAKSNKEVVEPRAMAALALLLGTVLDPDLMGEVSEDVVYP